MPPALRPSPWTAESDSGRAFDSLFNNHKYSDATVYLGQSKIPFPAHRLVLGIRSPYFDDALQSGFKEGITHEISFEKDSPHALWRVLHYIYTGDYSDEPSERLDFEGDDLELLRHPRVYALADMFRMEDLMKVSCKKFELQLKQHWISDTFPDCIREVYSISSNSTAIRKVIVDIVSSHKQELVQKRPFQEVIREVGDFAVELVLKIAKE
ncbi:hypothetical protein DL98DRAFT_521243 [Cadophora sp. DSE1049]|nr:hypothetical protein DL98DRAFT_521243 [Cadophora sp. DSE1049]